MRDEKQKNALQEPHFGVSIANMAEENRDTGSWLKRMERKLDRCNHLMELMRTCLASATLILQVVILLKLFNMI